MKLIMRNHHSSAFCGLFAAVFTLFAPSAPTAGAQSPDADPPGTLTYSLPSTVITIEVEAVREQFFAGPYARYAEKYLGISVPQEDRVSYSISSVTMTPRVEADQSARHVLAASGKDVEAAVLKLTSQGLVSVADAEFGQGAGWRFPAVSSGDFSSLAVTSNLTEESAVLYRKAKGSMSPGKVSVRQDMVVEKSLEKRASEAASMIFDLRQKRLQIVTGDTDATYSGEAMAAAVEELTRLEREYMLMFTGYSETGVQKKSFDVIPDRTRQTQMYVAFRISDTDGLLPPDNLSGRPVALEIVPQEIPAPEVDPKKAKGSRVLSVVYRIPAACTVRLIDDMEVMMQSRMLVYQLGRESSLPVNASVK